MEKNIEKITNHLSFLGYQIEKLQMPSGNDKAWYVARHSKNHNIILIEITPAVTMLRVGLKTGKTLSNEMIIYVNTANKALTMNKVYFEISEGNVDVQFEACYSGEYAKEVFGEFYEMFQNDIRLFYGMENFNKIWID